MKFKSLFFFKSFSLRLGSNVKIVGLSSKIQVGKNVEVYSNSIFELHESSFLHIGDNVVVSYGCLLSVRESLRIGRNTQIGEYTSIRDSTHSYDQIDVPIKYQADRVESILIGDNVWIGRGCIILPGTIIEDGAVIAANSVVKGLIESNKIYAGSPVKLIKERAYTR